MTALRPERESGAAYGDAADDGVSYGQQPYEGSGAWQGQQWYEGAGHGPPSYGQPSGEATAVFPVYEGPEVVSPYEDPVAVAAYDVPAQGGGYASFEAPVDSEAVARAMDARGALRAVDRAGEPPAPGGRAARRKAARRHGRHAGRPQTAEKPAGSAGAAPLSRVEARRAARARKPGAAVIASRVLGELFITTGVVMLLFVTYQLWWSNVRAHQEAGSAAKHLQQDWASGKREPGEFAPGQGFAILHIPKLDVVVPIAEGISKPAVLDKGMVGHYGEGGLKTAMPDAKTGNFGLAGHRNTHGEPFRYINRLRPGDAVVVETQDEYYVYKMASVLPATSPSNTSVLDPVPKGSGFTKPGRYITLTTCTPEFTSKYRLIVWGKMVEERPRSKGKPDALIS
ncbi:class E sortase [Streptomyces colonosanans]|uniref:Class E sortase n=1 Tax=Streptomyces colonosanans TaxID=1428652 RepID=A0A1S2PDK1_9ACTN|nr:class E sortase [Streptomyces colonosanans]OIJ91919.1 class E sortase [Streptomyces colonosanans]